MHIFTFGASLCISLPLLQLEVTLDLAERREIRSAIRELRNKELERCEEALASKRFRSERGQEDKENQPGLVNVFVF